MTCFYWNGLLDPDAWVALAVAIAPLIWVWNLVDAHEKDEERWRWFLRGPDGGNRDG